MTNRKKSAAGGGGRAKTLRLSQAAFEQVEEHAAAIAVGLAEGARNGNCMSIRLLIKLAEAGAEAKQELEAHPLLSLAMRLAMEPALPDDAADGEVRNEKQARN